MAVSTLRAGLCLALLLASVPVAGAPTAPTPASARLDFDSFRREIEPIFLGYAYVHSLPDLKEVGRVFVGHIPSG